jgi:hydrogenase nickel incorporation protein HypA/HybF
MHELPLALSVWEIAAEEAKRHEGSVKTIHIKLGPLSGVVAPALVSAFSLAREQTPFADCQLIIEEVPIVAYCATCTALRQPESLQWLCCPECGAPMPDIRQGREMEVTAMEIES